MRAAELPSAHQWELDLRTVLVSADPTRVDQVLAGLFGNAARFTPPGGTIRVALHSQAGEALLSIEDGGPGIKHELLPQILQQGVSLNLLRRLVEAHGGALEVENRADGTGARFTVRLPAIPEPEPLGQRPTRPAPSPRPSRQARVLIVEDNDDARIMLQRILQSDGHLVSAARDARAGLEAAIAGSPNVAVVDIGLPGMNGYQFARALRERLGNGVRLIALTGYGTDSDRQRAAEAGFDTHLTKPVDLERLLALVNQSPQAS
jgi:CheY-like chemotaxis protein